METTLITNGRVIDPSQKIDRKLTVVIEDGKIAQLTESRQVPRRAQVIDAAGAIVAPGFIDLHVHLRDPGQEYKEDIETGTLAAARGGFTLVCCMPNTDPVNDKGAVTEYIVQRAKEVGKVGVLPLGAISRGQKGERLADIGDMAAAGVIALSDDGRWVANSSLMRRGMEYAKGYGLPVVTHAEDMTLRCGGVMHEGPVATEIGLAGIPSACEAIAVARDCLLAELTGAHLHVAHISCAESVEIIRQAKRRKVKVTCEVTPHHLCLTDEAVRGYDPNTKMNPPLRAESDRRALMHGLVDGTIDCIATDHAPHGLVDKEVGFDLAAFGIVGLETALPLCMQLVHQKIITLKHLVALFTSQPANVFGLKKRGSLKSGMDANVTIFDPDHPVRINADQFVTKGKNTPFHGWKLKGKVQTTIVNGKMVYGA